MLPFDNKNEFQVIIDMPEGTTLERTAVVAKELSAYIAQQENVVNYQTYVGTCLSDEFQWIVRHYDLRRGSNVADIQVNLMDKGRTGNYRVTTLQRPCVRDCISWQKNTMQMSKWWKYLQVLR